jgi:hypothetical protein
MTNESVLSLCQFWEKVFLWLTGKSKKSTTVPGQTVTAAEAVDVNTALFQSNANSVDQIDAEGVDLNL